MDSRVSRRRFLAASVAGVAAGLAGCGQRVGPTGTPNGSTPERTRDGGGSSPGTSGRAPAAVGLDTLARGLEMPVDVAFAPDADRRYVVDRPGRILVHGPTGSLREEPFLDLRDAVLTGGERGLLGLALHPAFASNRRLYVRYSAPPRSGTPGGYSHTFVVAELEATADGRGVVPGSERTVLEIPQPRANHNAGDLAFGPDGYLYVPVGDGGGADDTGTGHVDDWYDAVGGGNGQDVTENLLGSVLRIDVDGRDGDRAYAVPDDNPLVGRPGLDEHYAWGFRNPWRLSFDGSDLFVGDVGQNRFEEVDLVEKGGNYGWNVREGAHCFRDENCPDGTPADVRGGEAFVDPIVEYPHSGAPVSGISVIGGVVYRGDALALEGTYVFGDLRANGRLFAAAPDDDGEWSARVVEVANDAGRLNRLLAFGRDDDGEVYTLGMGDDGGAIHRLVPAGGTPS